MLWPFVLPFKITFWILAGLVAVATVLAPRFGWGRSKCFSFSLIAAVLVFVPSCTAIMTIVDGKRFGVFEVDSHQVLDDPRVGFFLPTAARSITIDKAPSGFRARFTITADDLDLWFNGFWQQYGSDSIIDRNDQPNGPDSLQDDIDFQFEGLNFKPPPDMKLYRGPTASDGAGFDLWYDQKTQTAYQRTAYF